MKKIIIVFVMLLSVSIASAKGPRLIGSWMSEKVVVNGTDHQMFMPITFEADHDIISDVDVFGVWHYDKKTKLVKINSFSIGEFSGDWEVVEVSTERLILKMGELEWHLFNYDKTAIATTNAKLGLEGKWQMESRTAIDTQEALGEEDDNEDQTSSTTITFEGINFSLEAEQEGYSSQTKGSWVYQPKQNAILFIGGRRAPIMGTAKIIRHSDNSLTFDNKGYTYIFKK